MSSIIDRALNIIGDNLKSVSQKLTTLLEANQSNPSRLDSTIANRVALRSGQIEVYIGLYCTDGLNITAWERVVNHLLSQLVSRPVYADEEDLKALLRTKEKPQNEAYVKAYINQTDILELPPERALLDKRGKPRLTLKDRVLSLSNITRFIHHTGAYDFIEGRLIKQN